MKKNLLLAMSFLTAFSLSSYSQTLLNREHGQEIRMLAPGMSEFKVSPAEHSFSSHIFKSVNSELKELGYSNSEDEIGGVGTGKPGTFKCAAYFPKLLVGSIQNGKIEYINIGLGGVTKVTDLTVWISEDLTTYKYTKKIDTFNSGWNRITLDEPVEMTENGMYIGYTLTIASDASEKECYPIGVNGSEKQNALLLNDGTGWQDLNGNGLGVLAMNFGVSGDFVSVDAAIGSASMFNTKKGEPVNVDVELANTGVEPINSVKFRYVMGDVTKTADLTLKTPIEFFDATSVVVTLAPNEKVGMYNVDLEVIEVNGKPDEYADNNKASTGNVVNVGKEVNRRSVMEEGTATWCGWCPRGFVAMERLHKTYPDNFVGITVHGNDAFQINGANNYNGVLNFFSGFPSALVDRRYINDPYFDIEEVFLACNSIPAEGEISVSAELKNSNKQLEVTSETTFYFDHESTPYRVAYILLEDSVPGTQSNYYSGMGGLPSDLQFLAKLGVSYKTKYNDLAIGAYSCMGLEGSLTGAIKFGEKKTHTYTIDLPSTIKNIQNVSLVALLVADGTNSIEIVNAERYYLKELVGVKDVNVDKLDVDVRAVNGQLVLESSLDKALDAEVYTSAGVLVEKVSFENSKTVDLQSGNVYIIRITDGNNVNIKKVVL